MRNNHVLLRENLLHVAEAVAGANDCLLDALATKEDGSYKVPRALLMAEDVVKRLTAAAGAINAALHLHGLDMSTPVKE